MQYRYVDQDIEFTLAPDAAEQAYVIGSFTHWRLSDDFKMVAQDNEWVLRVSLSQLQRIGNSGYPEFYFWDESKQVKVGFDSTCPRGYFFNSQAGIAGSQVDYNYLVLPQTVTAAQIEKIAADNEASFIIKSQQEHFSSSHQLANFRGIQGGQLADNRLFRSYHPVITSRQYSADLAEIEMLRIRTVQKLLQGNQIATVINLSDTEETLADYLKSEPDSYYKQLWQQGHVHSLPISYETVYFMSDRNEPFNEGEYGFEDAMCRLITLIAENPGPYLVHCRLGSDRTGVTSAFLQSFMGASKEDIIHSFLQTNQVGMGEFRSEALLTSALTRALGDAWHSDALGVEQYLQQLGLNPEIMRKARHHLSAE